MATGQLGGFHMEEWNRDTLLSYGSKLYYALITNYGAVDVDGEVGRALTSTSNLKQLRELVKYLYSTLWAAEESRRRNLPPVDIALTW
jgi:hypothetical protein